MVYIIRDNSVFRRSPEPFCFQESVLTALKQVFFQDSPSREVPCGQDVQKYGLLRSPFLLLSDRNGSDLHRESRRWREALAISGQRNSSSFPRMSLLTWARPSIFRSLDSDNSDDFLSRVAPYHAGVGFSMDQSRMLFSFTYLFTLLCCLQNRGQHFYLMDPLTQWGA